MPNLHIIDEFGLDVTAQPASGSALSKYFKDLPDLAVSGINLARLGPGNLADPTLTSLDGGLSFGEPVALGTGAVCLTIGAGAGGSLSIFVPPHDQAPLFAPDLFGDNILVEKTERYVAVGFKAEIKAGISAESGSLTFGFNGCSGVDLKYCQLFETASAAPTVIAAVESAIAGFCAPGNIGDIQGMPKGSIALVESTGDLKFSGAVNLLTVANPLASASLPVAGDLKVNACGSINVGAAFEFSGDYQIRAHKTSDQGFHLGFYRKRDRDFSVTASADEGIGDNPDQSGLLAKILQAISSDPAADQQRLRAEGLSSDQAGNIQKAIKSAVDRSLALGASLELDASAESDAMFLFDIALSALAADGTALIEHALRGNLSPLLAREKSLPAGIRIVKSLVSSSKTFKHAFKVNLLGIYNFADIASLVLEHSVAWNRATGELLITDSANASRAGIDARDFGADPNKLHHLLSESFIITAAYRSGSCAPGPPSLQASHSYFDLRAKASVRQVRHDLALAAGLGLTGMTQALAKLPQDVTDFGQTTVYAEASYDDAALTALFLNGDQPLATEIYDAAGRTAIRFLVQAGDDDDFRLGPAIDSALWKKIREIGNTQSAQFAGLFPNLSSRPAAIAAIAGDCQNIISLAKVMQPAAKKLLAIRQFLRSNPGVSRDDPEFLKLRLALAGHLGSVSKEGNIDFGGPWGLLAMRQLSLRASTKLLLLSPRLTFQLEQDLPLAQMAPGGQHA